VHRPYTFGRVSDPVIRPATLSDVEELVALRRQFTFEDDVGEELPELPKYEEECGAFFEQAIERGTWQIWVAEVDGRIASHMCVALVDKVPRPIREHRRIAYLTNVYTRPEFRGRGIGSRVLEQAQAAAREADVELMLVWPSEGSIDFYERHDFAPPDDLLTWDAW
jgi:GNAT superfamily N-acetyltransferase